MLIATIDIAIYLIFEITCVDREEGTRERMALRSVMSFFNNQIEALYSIVI